MTSIPKRIDDDQYDKLLRRIWDLEQKVAIQDKVIMDTVQLGQVFDRQRVSEGRLAKIEQALFQVAAGPLNNNYTPNDTHHASGQMAKD